MGGGEMCRPEHALFVASEPHQVKVHRRHDPRPIQNSSNLQQRGGAGSVVEGAGRVRRIEVSRKDHRLRRVRSGNPCHEVVGRTRHHHVHVPRQTRGANLLQCLPSADAGSTQSLQTHHQERNRGIGLDVAADARVQNERTVALADDQRVLGDDDDPRRPRAKDRRDPPIRVGGAHEDPIDEGEIDKGDGALQIPLTERLDLLGRAEDRDRSLRGHRVIVAVAEVAIRVVQRSQLGAVGMPGNGICRHFDFETF